MSRVARPKKSSPVATANDFLSEGSVGEGEGEGVGVGVGGGGELDAKVRNRV